MIFKSKTVKNFKTFFGFFNASHNLLFISQLKSNLLLIFHTNIYCLKLLTILLTINPLNHQIMSLLIKMIEISQINTY